MESRRKAVVDMSSSNVSSADTYTSILNSLEHLIRESVGSPVIWDEKSKHVKGKYFYMSINGVQVGILLGLMNDGSDGRPGRCIALCFTDPKGRIDRGIAERVEALFRAMMQHGTLHGFKMIRDDLPALIKVVSVNDANEAMDFFSSSLKALLDVLREVSRSRSR